MTDQDTGERAMNEVRPQRERRERDDGLVDGHKILLLHKNGEESEAGAI